MKRIFVFILAGLMVMGSVTYVLYFIINGSMRVSAAASDGKNRRIRVGVIYGSGVSDGVTVSSENGLSLGYLDEGNDFFSLMQVTDKTLAVTVDENLKNSGGSFSSSSGDADIYSYHIQLTGSSNAIYRLEALIEEATGDRDVFPAYINGKYCLRVGCYSSVENARGSCGRKLAAIRASSAATAEIISLFEKAEFVSPSKTAVSVVDPSDNEISFEFDVSDGSKMFGIEAVSSGSGKTYLTIPSYNSYIYEGVFRFHRWSSDSYSGVALTNVVPIETYVAGVLPYEIGTYWSLEVQKAFAVCVRSYVIANLGRHNKTYGIDICNSSHCQVYRGSTKAAAITWQAVNETAGIVATWNGKVCTTPYSSSTGGVTVSAADTYGSSPSAYPYLSAVSTPWEKYDKHSNGSWTTAVSPEELLKTLRNNGYTTLKGSIASVKINELAKNSSYVKSITFTDIYGTSVTVNRCDKVKASVSSYVKSGNFVVAKAGEKVDITDWSLKGWRSDGKSDAVSDGSSVITGGGNEKLYGSQTMTVITDSGKKTFKDSDSISVITGSGNKSFDMTNELSGKSGLLDVLNMERISSVRTVTAEGPSGYFVFIGRGWGHGVGASQYGIKDLGDLGYSYDVVVRAYYTGAELKYYYDVIK